MKKYKILDLEFSNKSEIKNYIKEMLVNAKDMYDINQDFIKELMKFYDNGDYNEIVNFKSFVALKNEYNKYGIYILKTNDTLTPVSYIRCVDNIPFSEDKKIDYIFKFGKYKGQSIYDINDNNYIQWCLQADFLNRKDKIYLNQFLKYGYIPFNIMMILNSNNIKE